MSDSLDTVYSQRALVSLQKCVFLFVCVCWSEWIFDLPRSGETDGVFILSGRRLNVWTTAWDHLLHHFLCSTLSDSLAEKVAMLLWWIHGEGGAPLMGCSLQFLWTKTKHHPPPTPAAAMCSAQHVEIPNFYTSQVTLRTFPQLLLCYSIK